MAFDGPRAAGFGGGGWTAIAEKVNNGLVGVAASGAVGGIGGNDPDELESSTWAPGVASGDRPRAAGFGGGGWTANAEKVKSRLGGATASGAAGGIAGIAGGDSSPGDIESSTSSTSSSSSISSSSSAISSASRKLRSSNWDNPRRMCSIGGGGSTDMIQAMSICRLPAGRPAAAFEDDLKECRTGAAAPAARNVLPSLVGTSNVLVSRNLYSDADDTTMAASKHCTRYDEQTGTRCSFIAAFRRGH
jgi:hypothetical protein